MDDEWLPIASAPRDLNILILLWSSYDGFEIGYYSDSLSGWTDQTSEESLTPTHWMHLPKPPERIVNANVVKSA
jgi:hypothetical protein